MPTPSNITLGDNPSLKEVVDYVVKLQRDYEWLLQNLDDLNVKRLTADVLYAGTIDASIINVENIDADNIVTGTLDADVVTIRSDLTGSAYVQIDGSGMVINNGAYNTFTANSAGQVTMTSALIQSSPSGYPRIEMDPSTNRIAAWESSGNGVYLTPGNGTDPAGLIFVKGVDTTYLQYTTSSRFLIDNVNGIELVSSAGPIYIGDGLSAYGVIFPSWGDIINDSTSQSLQAALNGKATAGASTGSGGSAFRDGGIPIGTNLAISGGGSVAWAGISIPAHSHIQS